MVFLMRVKSKVFDIFDVLGSSGACFTAPLQVESEVSLGCEGIGDLVDR